MRNVALPQGHIALWIPSKSLIGPLERTKIRLEHISIDSGGDPEGDQELARGEFLQSADHPSDLVFPWKALRLLSIH